MYKFKLYSFSFIIIALLSIGCSSDSRNDMEKRIGGKWKQVGGTGVIADMNMVFEYEFKSNNEFKQTGNAPEGTTVIYKSGFVQEGIYKINNDSLYLMNDNSSADAIYSAKMQFISDDKFISFDSNGELDFEREK